MSALILYLIEPVSSPANSSSSLASAFAHNSSYCINWVILILPLGPATVPLDNGTSSIIVGSSDLNLLDDVTPPSKILSGNKFAYFLV